MENLVGIIVVGIIVLWAYIKCRTVARKAMHQQNVKAYEEQKRKIEQKPKPAPTITPKVSPKPTQKIYTISIRNRRNITHEKLCSVFLESHDITEIEELKEKYGNIKIIIQGEKDEIHTLHGRKIKTPYIDKWTYLTCDELIDFSNSEYQKRQERAKLTSKLRKEVKTRDNYTCRLCGKQMFDNVGLHIDHIMPIAKGGKTELSNLQVLCSVCNLKKSDKI